MAAASFRTGAVPGTPQSGRHTGGSGTGVVPVTGGTVGPGTVSERRWITGSNMEDSFEFLFNGTVNKIKSHKMNLNLSESRTAPSLKNSAAELSSDSPLTTQAFY